MTKDEFEAEFQEKIRFPYLDAQHGHREGPMWHQYVDGNLYKLPDEALRYIVNDTTHVFGWWLKKRAIDLTVFEDIVLRGGEDGQSD